jgi:hypothetical protein
MTELVNHFGLYYYVNFDDRHNSWDIWLGTEYHTNWEFNERVHWNFN